MTIGFLQMQNPDWSKSSAFVKRWVGCNFLSIQDRNCDSDRLWSTCKNAPNPGKKQESIHLPAMILTQTGRRSLKNLSEPSEPSHPTSLCVCVCVCSAAGQGHAPKQVATHSCPITACNTALRFKQHFTTSPPSPDWHPSLKTMFWGRRHQQGFWVVFFFWLSFPAPQRGCMGTRLGLSSA